jgi:hypothetical protein
MTLLNNEKRFKALKKSLKLLATIKDASQPFIPGFHLTPILPLKHPFIRFLFGLLEND